MCIGKHIKEMGNLICDHWRSPKQSSRAVRRKHNTRYKADVKLKRKWSLNGRRNFKRVNYDEYGIEAEELLEAQHAGDNSSGKSGIWKLMMRVRTRELIINQPDNQKENSYKEQYNEQACPGEYTKSSNVHTSKQSFETTDLHCGVGSLNMSQNTASCSHCCCHCHKFHHQAPHLVQLPRIIVEAQMETRKKRPEGRIQLGQRSISEDDEVFLVVPHMSSRSLSPSSGVNNVSTVKPVRWNTSL
ncbi:unnamed protein product [Owenia fusiformis]|uniref:Uncharacterized protein n=1 Tax=Owenia fusiformis TaxID=6347 RepID=A0A8S4QBY3_OWEFU|nr:unnamed protein product [Owenia fusiformis]